MKGLWKTKSGEILKISGMGDDHILSTHRFLQRKLSELEELPYPDFNGEMAQLHAESAWENAWEAVIPLIDKIEEFSREIKRRNIRLKNYV